MAAPSKKILVFGATGVLGKALVNALANTKKHFERIGIFTSVETAETKKELLDSFKSRGVDMIVGDLYNDNDVLEAYTGFDTVISAVGRFAIEKQIDLLALAEKSSTIIRFLPSEFGTDIAYNESSATEVPNQKKLKVRAYIDANVRRLTYTYLVTGPYADLYLGNMASEPQMGSFDVQKREATVLGDGKGPVSMTTMADVGRMLVAVLKHPEVCDGQAIRVSSFTTTPDEIVAELERQTECTWKVEHTSLGELRRLEERAYDQGNSLASLYTLRRIWTEGGTLYDRMDNEDIGITKTDSLEMVVQEVIRTPVAAFQSGKL